MSAELEDLQWKAGKIAKQIHAIECARTYEAALPLLGNCYRYSNCYRSGSRWWLYRRVTAVDKGGWLTVFDFQRCDDNRFEIRPANLLISTSELGEPITLKQFQHAWKIHARMLNDKARLAKAYAP